MRWVSFTERIKHVSLCFLQTETCNSPLSSESTNDNLDANQAETMMDESASLWNEKLENELLRGKSMASALRIDWVGSHCDRKEAPWALLSNSFVKVGTAGCCVALLFQTTVGLSNGSKRSAGCCIALRLQEGTKLPHSVPHVAILPLPPFSCLYRAWHAMCAWLLPAIQEDFERSREVGKTCSCVASSRYGFLFAVATPATSDVDATVPLAVNRDAMKVLMCPDLLHSPLPEGLRKIKMILVWGQRLPFLRK